MKDRIPAILITLTLAAAIGSTATAAATTVPLVLGAWIGLGAIAVAAAGIHQCPVQRSPLATRTAPVVEAGFQRHAGTRAGTRAA